MEKKILRHNYFVGLLSLILLLCGAQPRALGQTPAAANTQTPESPVVLTPHAEKIRKKIQKMGVGKKITVIIADGDDFYGSISKINADSFEIVEVDQKQRITLKYEQAKNVRSRYGGRSAFGGRANPLVDFAAIGGVIGLIIFAVSIAGGS